MNVSPKKVIWLRRATKAFDAHLMYLAQERDLKFAKNVARGVMSTVAKLSVFPSVGRPGRVKDTRELVLSGTSLIAVYRVREETVEIITVIHSSQQYPVE